MIKFNENICVRESLINLYKGLCFDCYNDLDLILCVI